MAFTHLHVHTQYSILDGSNKIKELVKKTKELGMDSIAITDHGVMYGVIEFYKACRAEGIKPIIGCEVYVAPGSRFDKELKKEDDKYYHLILLAENNIGYENLSKIVSIGFIDGFYYKPRVDMETLEKYHEGLICTSACLAGEVSRNLARGDYESGKEAALRYEKIFGKGNFFLELQDHGIPEQQLVNSNMLRLSEETGIELICTNDAHYLTAEDAKAHDILLCIQTGKKVSDEDRMKYEGGQYYLKSEEEMRALFPYALSAVENTKKIADRCDVEIEFGVSKLPKYDTPKEYTSLSYLEYLCKLGLEKRYTPEVLEKLHLTKEDVENRLKYEIDTINSMGFVDYFLIIWDFINYAKEHDIPVGPGRGSAAGSVVSYCLFITDIDPIKYSLIFERFLNPERVTMPDVDIDFCVDRRAEVIDYVTQKYGREKVSQIITFNTMAARGVIRDVGRVLEIPLTRVNQIAKLVPSAPKMTIDLALKENPEFREVYESDRETKEYIDMCKRLEGLQRSVGIHPAGVVICNAPVMDYVPLSRGAEGNITTQFEAVTIESLGLLKMDFLALRNLTVIKHALDLIYKTTGKKIDISKIDLDDSKVLDMIGQGKCDGVFQLESSGMKSFMKELKPNSFEDIVAGISLYRPGPMDFIPKYLAGKNDPEHISYECEQLVPILKPTYGCIVYQEQVMQIVRDLGGFSLGRSDNLRRAMSKKKVDVMQSERTAFVEGCLKNGIDEKVANTIYDSMIDFAKYAFNKSHAAAYAVVSMRTAFLKYYYPVEYMAALLTSVMGETTKVSDYIYECRDMGVNVLPPDINAGESGFSVKDGNIIYGLSAIKGIGINVIDRIVEEREESGPYKDMDDFAQRLYDKGVNKKIIENLIKAGAFDSFAANRNQMLIAFPVVFDNKSSEKKKTIAGQMSLFDMGDEEIKESIKTPLPPVPELDKEELLSYEKEVLGIYVSGHPLENYTDLLKKNVKNSTKDFIREVVRDAEGNEISSECKVNDGDFTVIGGILNDVKTKTTKNNTIMAFADLEDLYGSIEVIIFPNSYMPNRENLVEGEKVLIEGRIQFEDEDTARVIASNIMNFNQVPKKIWLRFKDNEHYNSLKTEVEDLLKTSDGNDRVVIYKEKEKEKFMLPVRYLVDVNKDLVEEFEAILGEKNVAVTYEKAYFKHGRSR